MPFLTFLKISFLILLNLGFLNYTHAGMFDRRASDGRLVFDSLIGQGLPHEAVDLLFRMFDYNEGIIPNIDSAVIVDYSKPSTVKRLYLLNLVEGTFESFYVAHGIRSGILEARNFSNLSETWKSSLGFYFAKGTFLGKKNGLSLYLDGVDASNDNARVRNIVLHGAKYVSEDFIRQNGRLGWSEGCFAVGVEHLNYLVTSLQAGSLILSYHKDLMKYARRNPQEQALIGDEYIPAGVNQQRVPGEGGGVDLLSFQYKHVFNDSGLHHHLK